MIVPPTEPDLIKMFPVVPLIDARDGKLHPIVVTLAPVPTGLAPVPATTMSYPDTDETAV